MSLGIVSIGGASFGGGNFSVIAGPCAVETDYVVHARAAAESGADVLRACIFKPRSAPNRFQGVGGELGLPLIAEARSSTGLPLLAEPLDGSDVSLLAPHVDAFLIGARSMRNSRLLHVVGEAGLPVVLKRSFAATYEEWVGAADWIREAGNNNVIFCERGIRTFIATTRNTLDISAVPVMRELTDSPIIVDPSHASGQRRWVLPLSMAAAAAGSDGLLVESHVDPAASWTDSAQSLSSGALLHLVHASREVARVSRRHTGAAPDPAV